MRCIYLDGEEIWIEKKGDTLRFFFERERPHELCEEIEPGVYAASSSVPPTPDSCRINLRKLFELCGEQAFHMAGRARQILHWRHTHRFCGACGDPLVRHDSETAMICARCSLSFYPRVNPVVITLIHRDDRILLARRCDPHFSHFWSVVAGFVEAGESLEDAVRREIREEVGLEVKNIRNFASQQWPFPNNLMIGFYAEYESGEPTPDGEEIAEARWFRRDNLPRIPSRVSIARKLIDSFFEEKRRAKT